MNDVESAVLLLVGCHNRKGRGPEDIDGNVYVVVPTYFSLAVQGLENYYLYIMWKKCLKVQKSS